MLDSTKNARLRLSLAFPPGASRTRRTGKNPGHNAGVSRKVANARKHRIRKISGHCCDRSFRFCECVSRKLPTCCPDCVLPPFSLPSAFAGLNRGFTSGKIVYGHFAWVDFFAMIRLRVSSFSCEVLRWKGGVITWVAMRECEGNLLNKYFG